MPSGVGAFAWGLLVNRQSGEDENPSICNAELFKDVAVLEKQ